MAKRPYPVLMPSNQRSHTDVSFLRTAGIVAPIQVSMSAGLPLHLLPRLLWVSYGIVPLTEPLGKCACGCLRTKHCAEGQRKISSLKVCVLKNLAVSAEHVWFFKLHDFPFCVDPWYSEAVSSTSARSFLSRGFLLGGSWNNVSEQ